MKRLFFLATLIVISVLSAAECSAQATDSIAETKKTVYTPRTDLTADSVRHSIDNIRPYTLFQPGATAVYIKEYNGKRSEWGDKLIKMVETVEKTSVEDGALAVYVSHSFLDKKGGLSKYSAGQTHKVLIDPQGNYHLTHNPIADAATVVAERKGFGLLVEGQMEKGDKPRCGKMVYKTSVMGSARYYTTQYDGWEVLGEGQITVPAGTFDCVKLAGYISSKNRVTVWMARGIGIIRYDADNGKVKYLLESITYK